MFNFFKAYFLLEPEPEQDPVEKKPGAGAGQKWTGSATLRARVHKLHK